MNPQLFRASYRLFGHKVAVESDEPSFMTLMATSYERFRLGAASRSPADLAVAVLGLREPAPAVFLGDRVIQFAGRENFVAHAHMLLIEAAASLWDGHVLHGGAVARHGRAVLLVGSSGQGKTTLTLELVRRRWSFLSDEFGVLDRRGMVWPFPRRVGVSDDSIRQVGLAAPIETAPSPAFDQSSKRLIDVERFVPGSLASETPLGAVFLLRSNLDVGPTRSPDPVLGWEIAVNRMPQGFEEELLTLAPVQTMTRPDAGGHTLHVRLHRGVPFVTLFDALCAEHDVTVIHASPLDQSAPDFDKQPEVRAATAAEVVPELLQHDVSFGGRRLSGSDPREDLRGTYASMSTVLDRARPGMCFLRPGELTATADLVEQWASEPV